MKLALALSLGVFAACGGDDDDGGLETMSNPASATATVSQINSFGTAFASADGPSAATAAYSMGASAGGIVVPAADDGQQARKIGPAFASPEGCVCDEDGCTFTECGDAGGTWQIDGSISKSGDSFTFDYTMAFNQVGYNWTFETSGDITISVALIDGSLSSDGDGTFDDGMGNEIESSWGWDMTANDIGLDAGCAESGTMDASVDYSGSVNGQDYSYDGSATVTFGPTCGQAM